MSSQHLYLVLGLAALAHAPVLRAGDAPYRLSVERATELSLVPAHSIPGLPNPAVKDLEVRGCDIPQSYLRQGLHNAVSGEFTQPGQVDWAVLCFNGHKHQVLVFPAGAPPARPVAVPWDDTISIEKRGSNQWGYGFNYLIRPADEHKIRRYNDDFGGQTLPPITHLGLEVYCCEKASTIYYWQAGTWVELAGAD